jgi:hypothetical protein
VPGMPLVRDYHGSFQHPLRAFVIGACSLALAVLGFAVAVDVSGQHQTTDAVVTRIIQGRAVTLYRRVLTTVVTRNAQRVMLPGEPGRVVVIHTASKRTTRIIRLPATTSPSFPLLAAAATPITETAYQTYTVTVPAPASTVTQTVTTTVTSSPTSGTSTPASSGQ